MVQGVELSHRAVIWTVAGVRKYLQLVGYEMNCNDSQISYLPLAHIFDRSITQNAALLNLFGTATGMIMSDFRH